MDVAELEFEVDRTRVALDEARAVYERTNIEARDMALVRNAEFYFDQAQQQLDAARAKAAKATAKEEALEAARAAWRVERQPPDLVAAYRENTREGWARFDADMAEWKHKMREGLFSVYPWK